MRIIPPPETTLWQAAAIAPISTPIFAIPLISLLPGLYSSGGDFTLVATVAFFVSFVFGYLGMFLICVPIAAALTFLKKLNAVRVCVYTTMAGGAAWTALYWDAAEPFRSLFLTIAVGAGCSLGVSMVFCIVGGITIRSSRDRFAARLKW